MFFVLFSGVFVCQFVRFAHQVCKFQFAEHRTRTALLNRLFPTQLQTERTQKGTIRIGHCFFYCGSGLDWIIYISNEWDGAQGDKDPSTSYTCHTHKMDTACWFFFDIWLNGRLQTKPLGAQREKKTRPSQAKEREIVGEVVEKRLYFYVWNYAVEGWCAVCTEIL